MALRTNEAQLSLFPVDPMVVMAAQPAQAVSPAPPVFGFCQEENGTVTLKDALENGLKYLHEQASSGHRFTYAEVSKAIFAFKQWMKAMPEDEDGGRYARYFITEFMDSGFCLHPDDYPSYAFPAKSSVQIEGAVEDDVPVPDDVDQPEIPSDAAAVAEDEEGVSLEGDVTQDLSMLKMLFSSRVFNSITAIRGVRRNDPACRGVMERYQQRIQAVKSVSALESTTEEFLKSVSDVFRDVRAEMKAQEKLERLVDYVANPDEDEDEEEQCPLGDDNAPEGMAFP